LINKKEVVLEVKNLSIDIPVSQGILHAVDNINLHVGRGEILCVVGESGCGKSLTSLAIMGLLPKNAQRTAETLELNKEDLQELTERQLADIRGNRMAMIFQEPMTSLNPSFTIENQLLEPLLRHKELSKADARNKVIEMQRKKTGKLFNFCCYAPTLLANKNKSELKLMSKFGEDIGLLFQITDDLLDRKGKKKKIGKSTGKDKKKGKSTLISLLGVNNTIKFAKELRIKILRKLKKHGKKANELEKTINFVFERNF